MPIGVAIPGTICSPDLKFMAYLNPGLINKMLEIWVFVLFSFVWFVYPTVSNMKLRFVYKNIIMLKP